MCLDLVADGVENADGVKQNFQEWMGGLPAAEREILVSSYLHYAAAECEWARQMGEVTGKKKTGVIFSGKALKRIRGRTTTRHSAVCDRLQLAREYIAYLKAGQAEGQVNSKIRASSSKAEFIRAVLFSKAQRATADNKSISAARNILNRGLRELATAGGGVDSETSGLPAELLDGGKRGRRTLTEAEKSTPQHLMTCFRGKKGRHHHAMALREALYKWFVDIRAPPSPPFRATL